MPSIWILVSLGVIHAHQRRLANTKSLVHSGSTWDNWGVRHMVLKYTSSFTTKLSLQMTWKMSCWTVILTLSHPWLLSWLLLLFDPDIVEWHEAHITVHVYRRSDASPTVVTWSLLVIRLTTLASSSSIYVKRLLQQWWAIRRSCRRSIQRPILKLKSSICPILVPAESILNVQSRYFTPNLLIHEILNLRARLMVTCIECVQWFPWFQWMQYSFFLLMWKVWFDVMSCHSCWGLAALLYASRIRQQISLNFPSLNC